MPAKRRPNAHSASSDDLNTTPHESPYSRRPRRSVLSVNQTELAQTIVDLLRESEDDSGHLVCEHFIKLPSKRGNADYYDNVVEPIDLNKISQRVKMEEYRDLEILTTDIQLMVSNAKMYYAEDTEQYKDAQTLLDTYFDIKSRILNEDSDGPSPSKQRKVKRGKDFTIKIKARKCELQKVKTAVKQTISSADQYEIMKEVYESIVTETDEEGRVISELFMKLPDQAANPGYYEVIKDPIDMRTIFDRIENKEYKTLLDLKKDVRLMVKNAMTYNKSGSQVYQDAGTIKRLFEERIADCEKGKKVNDSSNVKSSARIKHRKSWTRGGDKVKVEKEPEQHEASITDHASDDFQALMYNEVVNYRDEHGNTITDPFMRLPNRRFYPTYYDEIDNPVSLKAIRKKITTQKYQNVAELHEDLELLTENAIKFNRNTAQIYKDAVTLKDFINSRISFYLSKEEAGLNTSTVSSRSQRHTRQNNMDVEPVASERDDEPPIAEAPAGGYGDSGKMMTSPAQQPTSSQAAAAAVVDTNAADKPTSPAPSQVVPYDSEVENTTTNSAIQKKKRRKKKGKVLQNHLRAIYETVLNSVSYDGREMITLFLDKPSRKDYPDYYRLILEPIDMKMIDKKIRNDKYINVEDMLEDFHLMFNNARHYNEPGSEVYLDANALEKIMNEKVRELGPLKDTSEDSFVEEKVEKTELEVAEEFEVEEIIDEKEDGKCVGKKLYRVKWKNSYSTWEPEDNLHNCAAIVGRWDKQKKKSKKVKTTPSSTFMLQEKTIENKLEKLFFHVRDYTDVTNRSICDIFTHLPTKHELPDYYKIIKKPMDMERIQQKMQGGQYIKLVELVTDMLLMFENACVYNEPGSVIYKDALILQHLAVDFFHEIEPAPTAPDVSLLVHELMCEIFIAVVYHQDENGRSYSESLFNFTGDEDNDEQGDGSEKPSLNLIQRNLRNHRYKRLDVFQDHMFSIFEEARSKNRTDSEMYEDVVELQKVFIKTRDELTKNGELMVSPAHDFTFHVLENELEMERKEKLPEEARQDKEIEKEGSELREKMQGKRATEAFKYKGENLQVGDYVYVDNGKSDVPHIVIIEKLYDENKDSGEVERMMYGCWFFRPKATFHLPNKKFLLKEVFKTDFYNTVPVSTICGRCYVMSSKDYFKMKPVGFPHDDVYVCESRYSTRAKTFKRIKQLAASLPECSSVELVRREKPLERVRVLSCFSAQQQQDSQQDQRNNREKLKITLMTERDATWSDLAIDVYRENTKSETQNPNNEATYYTQYLYNGTWIKLGDCVYVQELRCPKTRIARIERLWTDRSMNVWFHGPWFVECNDTKHEPTRMFYEKEVCISSEEATIRMTETIGKCVVLPVKDYQAMRPTELPEKDVYLFESKYFTSDETIKKVKSSRRYQPPNKVVEDEVYYFRKPLDLDICSSKLLRSIVAKEVENREAEMKAEQLKQQEMKMEVSPQHVASGLPPQQQYGPFPQHMYQQYNPRFQSSPLPPLPDTPIAQHRSMHQTPIPPPNFATPPSHRPPFPAAVAGVTPSTPGYPASPQFPVTPANNRPPSASTPSSSKRKNRGGHSTGYILFASHCHPRVRAENPDLPFGDISKLVGEEWRNLKDETKREFEEKAKEQTARAEAEGRIPPKKKKKKKDSSHQLDDSAAMSPSSVSQDSRQGQSTPAPPNGSGTFQQGGAPPGGNNQQANMYPASGQPQQQQPAPPYPTPQPPPITIQQQAATTNGIHVRKRGPLFVRPPPKPERVLMHSDAYFRYIEKLDKGSKSVGNWQQALRVKESDVHLSREDEAKLPTSWLGLGKGRHDSAKSALWALRNHMLKDALHMRNVLEWATEE